MRRIAFTVAALAALAAPLAAQEHQHDPSHHPGMMPPADTGFAAVQRRGARVMGVDQYTSRHVFEPLPDGGRIELQREADDSAGTAQIRRHLREVAAQFAAGDFTSPLAVHAREVPGTRVMAARRDAIRYEVRDLPRGGEIRIVTGDAEAVRAVHEFLAFQRQDHHAEAH